MNGTVTQQPARARKRKHAEQVNILYGELCKSYHAIDDMRLKLLKLLPLVTGTSVVLLLKSGGDKKLDATYLSPIGIFGFLVTLGLFFYEFHGIKKCGQLIRRGALLERKLRIAGQFRQLRYDAWSTRQAKQTKNSWWPDDWGPAMGASVIYSAAVSVWVGVAIFSLRWVPTAVAFFVFFLIFSLATVSQCHDRKDRMPRKTKREQRLQP